MEFTLNNQLHITRDGKNTFGKIVKTNAGYMAALINSFHNGYEVEEAFISSRDFKTEAGARRWIINYLYN